QRTRRCQPTQTQHSRSALLPPRDRRRTVTRPESGGSTSGRRRPTVSAAATVTTITAHPDRATARLTSIPSPAACLRPAERQPDEEGERLQGMVPEQPVGEGAHRRMGAPRPAAELDELPHDREEEQ